MLVSLTRITVVVEVVQDTTTTITLGLFLWGAYLSAFAWRTTTTVSIPLVS